jgi:MYXO-CTERM domain-containing protein
MLFGPIAPRAFAYVRYKTQTGAPYHWTNPSIAVQAYPDDLTEMPSAQSLHASSAAAAAWSKGMISCTALDITLSSHVGSAPADQTAATAIGAPNLLAFRNPWCSDPTMPCAVEALALTTAFFHQNSGEIVSAAIDVNNEFFTWADLDVTPSNNAQDLQNALTHEMGHLIGLDHNCYTSGSDPMRQIDNLGNAVPDCASAPPAVAAETMYVSAQPGDVSKRTPAPEELQAACDIYPLAPPPMGGASGAGGTTGSGGAMSAGGTTGAGGAGGGTGTGGATMDHGCSCAAAPGDGGGARATAGRIAAFGAPLAALAFARRRRRRR